MALMWPMGHGDSRVEPALNPDRGRESTNLETLDSRLRGSDGLVFWGAMVIPENLRVTDH